ncbi:MAG: MBL fold metallo-hydrolase [Clostridia bacterium]|nr:MBL fold metallo-hydrolase [Clostridia bacterium]
MKITWYGTATIGIDDGKTKLIFDPFVRMNKHMETTPVEGFVGFDAVFVTHGHFDHIYSIPALAEADKTVPIYCTETPKKTLTGRGVPEKRIKTIQPDDVVQIGEYTIRVHRFRHIVFDPIYILTVVPKCIVMLPRLFRQAYMNRKMPEGGEIVAYEIEAQGKKIFLTGSFREHPAELYPEDIDLLILANGGSIFVPEKTKGFIDRYHPKRIFVDHFDDAFPPVTRAVSVKRLKRMIKKNHPEIEFIIPEICKSIEL